MQQPSDNSDASSASTMRSMIGLGPNRFRRDLCTFHLTGQLHQTNPDVEAG